MLFKNSRGKTGVRCDECQQTIRVGHQVVVLIEGRLTGTNTRPAGVDVDTSKAPKPDHYHPNCL